MIRADAEAALFSVKSFAAAVLAYYVALRIGFAQPVWAVTTVYLVSQPLSGAVLSKALFRLLGTFLGGVAAVILLPAFVNEPLVLSLALALWLGLCVYIAQLDRTPRSYVFLLAGYTASIIGFPSVFAPGNIFNTAVLRVQEIGIGIVSASLIHSAIFPRSVTSRLQQQIGAIVASAEQSSRRSLAGSRDAALDRERRLLANGITEIEQLSFHVAFDTARLLPRPGVIRALQDQLSWLLPLSSVVEDRIAEYVAAEGALPTEIAALIADIDRWFVASLSESARDEHAQTHIGEAERLGRAIGIEAPWQWREMILASLLSRLAELVRAHRALRELHDRVISGSIRGLSSEAALLIRSASSGSAHRDHGIALRSALGSVVAVLSVCGFWIATAWSSGATAALLAGVGCALFASLPHPGIVIRRFFYGSLVGIVLAAVMGFAVFPRVTDFTILAAVLSPPLLLIGSILARPALAVYALGAVVGLLNTVGIAATYQSDFANFVNGSVAQIAGTAAAVFIVDVFQVTGAETAFARLFSAGFRDVAARAEGRARDTRRWMRRMIDRTALIAARAGPAGIHPALPPYDALVGLRIGYNAGELRAFSAALPDDAARLHLHAVLQHVSRHFRKLRPTDRTPAADAALQALDRAMAAFAADPMAERRYHATILLTGLRRNLFPDARAFDGAPE